MTDVILSIGNDADFEDVATACEQAGLTIEAEMPRIQILVGKIPEERVDALAEIPGVERVNFEQPAMS